MIFPPIRKQDSYGAGHYLAPRGDKRHQGIDFAAYPDSILLSDVEGVIKRIGHPYDPKSYKGGYTLVEITCENATVKYMYIEPFVPVGCLIEKGDIIGKVQDLGKIYPNIINHYHAEVWIDGSHVDPAEWFKNHA